MSDPIIDRLDQIKDRANKATEGPWVESWRQIPGYDGYEVSDCGNVRSYYLKGNYRAERKRSKHPRTLISVNARGYRTVSLPHGPKRVYRHIRIHALVMLAFVGPRPDGQEIAHLNGNPSDNRLENLAYVTHRENEAHKIEHGTLGAGESNSQAVLQGWQVAEMRYLANKSVSQGKIAALFDISHKRVSEILSGKVWQAKAARSDVPQMEQALRAVFDLHKPEARYLVWGYEEVSFSSVEDAAEFVGQPVEAEEFKLCAECKRVEDGAADNAAEIGYETSLWPCPTYQAMASALGVETEGGES